MKQSRVWLQRSMLALLIPQYRMIPGWWHVLLVIPFRFLCQTSLPACKWGVEWTDASVNRKDVYEIVGWWDWLRSRTWCNILKKCRLFMSPPRAPSVLFLICICSETTVVVLFSFQVWQRIYFDLKRLHMYVGRRLVTGLAIFLQEQGCCCCCTKLMPLSCRCSSFLCSSLWMTAENGTGSKLAR